MNGANRSRVTGRGDQRENSPEPGEYFVMNTNRQSSPSRYFSFALMIFSTILACSYAVNTVLSARAFNAFSQTTSSDHLRAEADADKRQVAAIALCRTDTQCITNAALKSDTPFALILAYSRLSFGAIKGSTAQRQAVYSRIVDVSRRPDIDGTALCSAALWKANLAIPWPVSAMRVQRAMPSCPGAMNRLGRLVSEYPNRIQPPK